MVWRISATRGAIVSTGCRVRSLSFVDVSPFWSIKVPSNLECVKSESQNESNITPQRCTSMIYSAWFKSNFFQVVAFIFDAAAAASIAPVVALPARPPPLVFSCGVIDKLFPHLIV
jgi:hypothetical protein